MSSTPLDHWRNAKLRYLETLTDRERQAFSAASLEALCETIDAAQELFSSDSDGHVFIRKLQPLLDTLEQYEKALDPSGSSIIMCPLYGSLRVLIMISSTFGRYCEKLIDMLARIGNVLPRFDAYAKRYKSQDDLLYDLSESYLGLVRFCTDAKEVFRQPSYEAMFNPYCCIEGRVRMVDTELYRSGPDDISACGKRWKDFRGRFKNLLSSFQRERDYFQRGAGIPRKEAAGDIAASDGVLGRATGEKAVNGAKRRRLLRKIAGDDQRYAHARLRKKRYSGTCEWVTDMAEYKDWIDGSSSMCLWCHGAPGCGKTIISNFIIDALISKHSHTQAAVAYHYCDYADKETLDFSGIFGSLTRQLLSIDWVSINGDIEKLITLSPDKGSTLPYNSDAVKLLREACSLLPLVYLVVDGLDECDDYVRTNVLHGLELIKNQGHTTVKILITSRSEMPAKRKPPKFLSLWLNPDSIAPDVLRVTNNLVHEKISSGELPDDDLTTAFETEVVSSLVGGPQRTFLWIESQFSRLCEKSSVDSVRWELENLPQDLYETYTRALWKIQTSADKKLARAVLTWLTVASRPLLLDELKEAVSIEPKDSQLGSPKLLEVEKILEACAGLVIFDEEDRTVRLIHRTVADAFMSAADFEDGTSNITSPDYAAADAYVAERCVTYLKFPCFGKQYAEDTRHLKRSRRSSFIGCLPGIRVEKTQPASSGTRDQQLQSKYRLLSYAIDNWLLHSRNLSRGNTNLWASFKHLTSDRSLSFTFKPWDLMRAHTPYEEKPHFMAFRWAVEHGHRTLLRLLSTESEFKDYCNQYITEGKTPFAVAAAFAHHQILEVLYAPLNTPDRPKQLDIAFSAALFTGDSDTVGVLLRLGADVEQLDGTTKTRLHRAVESGDARVVQLLLNFGAQVNAKFTPAHSACTSNCALHLAVDRGHHQVLQVLLDGEADIKVKDTDGHTALESASKKGHSQILSLLLDDGRFGSGNAGNSLGLAIQNGHAHIFQLLWQSGIRPKTPSSLLHSAAKSGHGNFVKMLLGMDTAIDPDDTNRALLEAAEEGHAEVVAVLIEYMDASGQAESSSDQALALYKAAKNGHDGVVDILIKHGASLGFRDAEGRTGLHWASMNGHGKVVRRLLESGEDCELCDSYEKTAFQLAAIKRQKAVISIFMAHGADSHDVSRLIQEKNLYDIGYDMDGYELGS